MQCARSITASLSVSRRSEPHSVSVVKSSLAWHPSYRLFAARLSRASIGIALVLSIQCGVACAAVAGPARAINFDPYAAFISEASQRFGLPASWLRAVIQVESGRNPKAVSPKGAMGLMQLMPDTWSALRVQYHLGSDPFDPHDNILGGTAYLRELFDRFGASGFLAAYNAGPKRFQDYLAGLRPLHDETKRYVSTLAQMLPDLQIGGALPALHVATDWRAASLFTTSATTPLSSTNGQDGTPSGDVTATNRFALSPQSDGLFVPVRLSGQR